MRVDERCTEPRRYSDDDTLKARYDIYRAHGVDGEGFDITTGLPAKSFDEWLAS